MCQGVQCSRDSDRAKPEVGAASDSFDVKSVLLLTYGALIALLPSPVTSRQGNHLSFTRVTASFAILMNWDRVQGTLVPS